MASPARHVRELCAPGVGPFVAYAGKRAADRYDSDGEKRHAVNMFALLSGALDAECGRIGFVEVGPWDPDDPHNCRKCARYIAGLMPMPADPPPAPVALVIEHGQLALAETGPHVERRRRPRPRPRVLVAVDQPGLFAATA